MILASPYDGYSRAPLRIAIALVASADAVAAAVTLARAHVGPHAHPMAPAWVTSLASNTPVLALVGALAVVALVRFATRPMRGREAFVGLALLALLVEAHAAVVGGPMRVFFASGTALLGWMLGLAYHAATRAPSDERAEILAEGGAVAALSAMYVGACVSKLSVAGVHWIDPAGLRELVYAQQRLAGPEVLRAYGRFVGEHTAVASALATMTLLIQGSAVLYGLSPRTRAVVGTLLLAFHFNVWLLTPIFFPQAMLLLVVFSYPWPRWLGRPQAAALGDATNGKGTGERRAAILGVAALLLVILATRVPALQRYTHLHHHTDVRPGTPAGPATTALLDGLVVGGIVVDDWRADEIVERPDGSVDVALIRAGALVRITVTPRGARDVPVPRQTEQHDLFYDASAGDGDGATPEERDGLLDVMTDRVRRGEAASRP